MRKIAIYGKGGIGKSTTTSNVAAGGGGDEKIPEPLLVQWKGEVRMLWQYLREQGAQTAGRKYLPELALRECGRIRKKKIGLCRKARGGSGAVSGLSRGGRKKRCASGWQERCCGVKKYHHRGK